MAKRRTRPGAVGMAAARLTVLAESDERAFTDAALEMLTSGDRLEREAALEALAERPSPRARESMRSLYLALDEDGLKHDQGAHQRVNIVRILRQLGDRRDADIGVRATDTYEKPFGEDTAWNLRAHGLMMLAELAPESFAFYAVEHLEDFAGPDETEPASTAFQLLIGRGDLVPVYQWLRSAGSGSGAAARVFELFAGAAPAEIVERFVVQSIEHALRHADEQMSMLFAEAIVRQEIEGAYAVLGEMMHTKISDELYSYLATLLAATNRAPLLAILEDQLHRGRRPRVVAEAMRLRPTDEQREILRRWEEGE